MLPAAGLSSALICISIDSTGVMGNRAMFTGAIFGVVVGGCLSFMENARSLVAGLIFAIACEVACWAAIIAGMYALLATFVILHLNSDAPAVSGGPGAGIPTLSFQPGAAAACLVGGTVGAAFVLMSTLMFFGPRTLNWNSVVRIMFWSPVGGGLALCGLGFARNPDDLMAVTILWQTGMAVAIHFLLLQERSG